MCVYEHLAPVDAFSARREGQPINPYLFILYREKIWEANPHSYGIVIPSEVLKDKTVCFTGEDKASREYWKAVVEAVGGINVSGVTRNTSFLVMADKTSTSTKAKSAARYGTICLSYNEFQKMIESS
jgi:NAD-dependent DNA ligase